MSVETRLESANKIAYAIDKTRTKYPYLENII